MRLDYPFYPAKCDGRPAGLVLGAVKKSNDTMLRYFLFD